ncbi:protein halfway isoform X2 [Ischnura elegans]|nr:protein halfway isoform X2 [Ischnura elegans]XP_046386775.1 protein halfway isoform X2 [Ischnura elegans]
MAATGRQGAARSVLFRRFDLFCLLLYAHAFLATAVPPTPPPDLPKECVSIPEEACPPAGSDCPCALSSDAHVLCCHLASAHKLWPGVECALSAVEASSIALHIRNSTLEGLALSVEAFPRRPELSSLTVTHSETPLEDLGYATLTSVASSVACLNLSVNAMGDLPAGALTGLSQLKALDLSHNNITQLPGLPSSVSRDQKLWVDISGNEKLGCSGIKEAMSWAASVDSASPPLLSNSSTSRNAIEVVVDVPSLPMHGHPPIVFHNKENTYCVSKMMKDLWFPWVERISLDKIEQALKLECPSGQGYTCFCSIKRFENSEFLVAVDCSNRGLSELPEILPKNTISLNVTNNKISSLDIFGTNVYYREIREFYADNNLITSIVPLEGSPFFNSFQHLSLSGNKLKHLPLYLLKRMFSEDSYVIRYLSLGKNEYHCDCNTYSGLKDWIMQYKKEVTDYEQMWCDSDVPDTKIIDLKAEEVCFSKHWKDYLPYVILLEVLLLIIIVTKVSYDYWIFKTKGYLPWPASRTPKLPCCDWAFDA